MSVSKQSKILSILMLMLFCFSVQAQKSKSDLEKEKQDNLRKIQAAEKILKDTEKERDATLGQLSALNEQIEGRENLIVGMNQEVKLLDKEIVDLNILIKSLQEDLEKLKKEYAEMIYITYRASQGYNKLTFLFSSESFNQLFMRLKYLNQYTEARKKQANQIEIVSSEMIRQKAEIESKRMEQNDLLDQQIQENKKLKGLKARQTSLVVQLRKKESDLQAELAQRKEANAKLDKLIADIVREMERAKSKSSEAIAKDVKLSAVFEENKFKLPWPVDGGFISSKFGKHAHPVLHGIVEDNPGVDIQTNKNAEVHAVFDGKVAAVAIVPGMNNVVLIQHGEYYTLYAKLKDVNVKKGQQVSRNELLGKVSADKDGVSEVHFEVWKEFQKLNPETWLSKK